MWVDPARSRRLVRVARGQEEADLVLRGGRVVNVFTGEVTPSSVAIADGAIAGVSDAYRGQREVDLQGAVVAPGLIDAHLHLESTMVAPSELVALVAAHGTTTLIADPHEAANVSGAAGIRYILDQTASCPTNVYVMLPSCVPATPLDDNGCTLTADDLRPFLDDPRVLGLAEVMDDAAVIDGDPAMLEKLALFPHGVIDGHAPSLAGGDLSAYRIAGVATDHEATTFDAALEEVRRGFHVHVREGSAAHNLEAIVSGIVRTGVPTAPFSFCTDDRHVEDIRREGHIDNCVRQAIRLGLDPVDAIRMATLNTARCYGLRHLGAIAPGRQADLVVVDDLRTFRVTGAWHAGRPVGGEGGRAGADGEGGRAGADGAPARADVPAGRGPVPAPPACPEALRHTMHVDPVAPDDFALPIVAGAVTHVIQMDPRQITTTDRALRLPATPDVEPGDGLLKIAAVERHHRTGRIGVALASGYGIRGGAMASSISHDAHNLIVIGDSNRDMALAANAVIAAQGGLALVRDGAVLDTLPLPIMGLLTDAGLDETQAQLARMRDEAYAMGVDRRYDPFVTLSFMALPVIPELRITPRGLCRFDESGPHLV